MGITNFPYGLSSFGQVLNGGMGVGNVYLVCQSAQTTVYADLNKKYGGVQYDDESYLFHSSIASALAACVAERNDYVVLMPDNDDYDLSATLTMSAKATHLICPANMGPSVATMNGCRVHLHSGTSAHVITVATGGAEVGGLYIKTCTDKYGISIPAGSSPSGFGLWIHNNTISFAGASSTADGGIIGASEGGGYSVIENNKLSGQVASCTHLSGITIDTGATACVVKKNLIIVGNTETMTTGINMQSYMGVCNDNDLIECAASGGTGAGTLTLGISYGVATMCFGNRIAITTEANAISGGTVDETAILNYEGTSGGTIAV